LWTSSVAGRILTIKDDGVERSQRSVYGQSGDRRLERVLDFLEREIWPNIPPQFLGRRIAKKERERILGYREPRGSKPAP